MHGGGGICCVCRMSEWWGVECTPPTPAVDTCFTVVLLTAGLSLLTISRMPPEAQRLWPFCIVIRWDKCCLCAGHWHPSPSHSAICADPPEEKRSVFVCVGTEKRHYLLPCGTAAPWNSAPRQGERRSLRERPFCAPAFWDKGSDSLPQTMASLLDLSHFMRRVKPVYIHFGNCLCCWCSLAAPGWLSWGYRPTPPLSLSLWSRWPSNEKGQSFAAGGSLAAALIGEKVPMLGRRRALLFNLGLKCLSICVPVFLPASMYC